MSHMELQPVKKQSGCLGKIVKGVLIVAGLFIALIVVVAIFAPKTPGATRSGRVEVATNASAPADANASVVVAAEAPAAVPVPAIGQDVMVDEVRWRILTAEDMGNLITDDNQFTDDLKTSGKFIKMRFEIENRSKDMLSFIGLDLIDNQGRSYTSSSNTYMFIDDSEMCILENLNPNITKTCTHIYEVPLDAAGLNANAGDLKMFGSTQMLISLGM